MYSDSGNRIKGNNKDKFKEYIDIVNQNNKGVLAFAHPWREKQWTKADIYNHFGVSLNDKKIIESFQYGAGKFHVVRKCKHSMKIYKLWWETAKNYPHYLMILLVLLLIYEAFVKTDMIRVYGLLFVKHRVQSIWILQNGRRFLYTGIIVVIKYK